MRSLLTLAILIVVVCAVVYSATAGATTALRTKVREGKLLNQYGFIQTHDSATGELDEDRDKILARWSRTQNGSILDQINCGARSLDYRPYLSKDGVLYAHHGPTVIYKAMRETLTELLQWGHNNPGELIIISLSHCVEERFHNNYYADACHESMLSLLSEMHIHTITSDNCSPLNTMTMEAALAKGPVLAMVGCATGYWDPSLTCTSKDYVCYDSWPANTSSIAWNKYLDSVYKWSSFIPVDDGTIWGFGANWQSSAESVVFGTLHNSSLVLDEERSNMNAFTAQAIRDGKFQYLNMVGVDNVCHNGEDIFQALQEYNAKL